MLKSLQEFGPNLNNTAINNIIEADTNLKIANIYFFFKLLIALIVIMIRENIMKKNQYVI